MAAVKKTVGHDGKARFQVRVYRDGRQYMGTGKTEAEARRRAEDRARERKGRVVPDAKQRLERHFEDWFAAQSQGWAEATKRGRRDLWERFIKDALGDCRLEELRLAVLRSWVDGLPTIDCKHRCVSLLRACLKRAVDDEILPVNPCTRLRLPKLERRQPRRWTAGEVRAFWALAREHAYHAYFAIALAAPLRPSEVLGLKWARVDLDAGTATIAEGRATFAQVTELSKLKTRTSGRLVHLPEWVAADLRRWKAEQNETRLRLGRAYTGGEYVCTGLHGGPLDLHTLRDAFHLLAAHAGLPRIKLYELRHTGVSNMMDAGVPSKVVAAAAGHARVATTENIYWQIRAGETADAAQALAAHYFPGDRGAVAVPE